VSPAKPAAKPAKPSAKSGKPTAPVATKATAAALPVITDRSPRLIGTVESDRRHKTRTVVIGYSARHPKYGKYIRRRTVLHVHDETNDSRTGDRVEIAECRPISKTKSWMLVRVVERGAGALPTLEGA
jgi:small subunit ribosomal protein S17